MIKLKDLIKESKYRAHVFADVADDIVKDERFSVDSIIDQGMAGRTELHIHNGGREKPKRLKKYCLPSTELKTLVSAQIIRMYPYRLIH